MDWLCALVMMDAAQVQLARSMVRLARSIRIPGGQRIFIGPRTILEHSLFGFPCLQQFISALMALKRPSQKSKLSFAEV